MGCRARDFRPRVTFAGCGAKSEDAIGAVERTTDDDFWQTDASYDVKKNFTLFSSIYSIRFKKKLG